MIFTTQQRADLAAALGVATQHLGSVEQKLQYLFDLIVDDPSPSQKLVLASWLTKIEEDNAKAITRFDVDAAAQKDTLIAVRDRVVALKDAITTDAAGTLRTA
jgi:hypothetical protein